MKKIFVISALFIGLLASPLLVKSEANLASRLVGKILLAVEDKGRTYFVHTDGNRYQITKETALPIFQKLALGINNENLNEIPLGDVGIDAEVEVVDTTPEVTPQPVTLSCDNTSYLSQITSLTSQLYKANQDIEKYKTYIGTENLGSADLPVVEVVKSIKYITECKININGTYCGIDISYLENGNKINTDVSVSVDDNGYFVSDGSSDIKCSGGVDANWDGSQRKGNFLTCNTHSSGDSMFHDSKPHISFTYLPNKSGERTITVIANGISETIKVKGQLEKCVDKRNEGDSEIWCNK